MPADKLPLVTAFPEAFLITAVTGTSAPSLSFKVAGRVAIASEAPIAEVVAVRLPVGATRVGSAGVVAGVKSLTFPAVSVAVTLIGTLGPTEPGRVTV